MSEKDFIDSVVVRMRWSDGSHACFFQSDTVAIEEYIRQKTLKAAGQSLEYVIEHYLKSEYDKLNGF